MGLFDKFSSSVELTPAIALATSMIYMMSSDGDLAEEEMNYLVITLNAIGDPQELIKKSVKYSKKQNLEEFLAEANELLNDEQKITILVNLIDLLLSDGNAEEEEENLFFSFVESLNIKKEDIEPYIEAISIKNNYSIFV